jgi:hypothetical protein
MTSIIHDMISERLQEREVPHARYSFSWLVNKTFSEWPQQFRNYVSSQLTALLARQIVCNKVDDTRGAVHTTVDGKRLFVFETT